MDERQLQTIKDLLAIHLEELKKQTAETVKHNVNGKVDAMNLKLTNYIHEDEKWKQRAEPLIRLYENAYGFNNVTVWGLKFLGLLAGGLGAVLLLKQIFK